MSNSKAKSSKAATVESVRALMAGAQKQLPNATFKFGSTEYSTPELVKLFQSLIDAISVANTAQATSTDAVVAMRATLAQVGPLIRDFRRQVKLTFGASSQTLVDFGLKPAKAPAPRTAEQKALAAAKQKATREARGTTSVKQKRAIKGNVIGVTITPVVEPDAATPAQATQPATTPAPQLAPTSSNTK